MLQKKRIETLDAPQAIGPYSQAIIAGEFVFCSGQIAIDPKTSKLVSGGIAEQTKQVLENIKSILKSANLDLSTVVKTEIYLSDMNNFSIVNDVYGEYFDFELKPARATIEVSRLPKDALVEISCIAYKK